MCTPLSAKLFPPGCCLSTVFLFVDRQVRFGGPSYLIGRPIIALARLYR